MKHGGEGILVQAPMEYSGDGNIKFIDGIMDHGSMQVHRHIKTEFALVYTNI